MHGMLDRAIPEISPNPVSQQPQKPKLAPIARVQRAASPLVVQGKEGGGEGKLRIEKDGFPPHASYRKSAKTKRHFFWRIE